MVRSFSVTGTGEVAPAAPVAMGPVDDSDCTLGLCCTEDEVAAVPALTLVLAVLAVDAVEGLMHMVREEMWSEDIKEGVAGTSQRYQVITESWQ